MTQLDKAVLRELGARYMEYASLPIQNEKINLWKALNRGQMKRPMVVIDQLPWSELNTNGELDCVVTDEYFRNIEASLRMQIYKWRHFPVDMVLDPYIAIPRAITNTGYGINAEVDRVFSENNDVAAQHFHNLINNEEDVAKIKDMQITHDEKKSEEYMQAAKEIFDGIADVKFSGMQFHLGVWDYLTMLMGVENIYIALIDEPELMHQCMRRITDSVLAGIKQANDLRIHDDIANACHCSYIFTDELLPEAGKGKGPVSENCWSMGLAQLFTSVSPQVTEEFELPYITEMAKHFGMIYYGCCDRLDDRMDVVKRIPNLKKLSCSPWSNKRRFAEQLGREIVMSAKPNPAYLAEGTMDEAEIRRDLQETVDIARAENVNLELILKDISSVRHDPKRLTRWAEIAMEVVGS